MRLHRQNRPPKAYLQLSDSTDQIPPNTSEYQVQLNTIDKQSGIDYSSNVITVIHSGVYTIVAGAQVGNNAPLIQVYADVWLKLNNVDIPNSSVRSGISSAETQVLVLNYVTELETGDDITVYAAVSSTVGQTGLYATSPTVGPDIPSIIFSMFKVH